MNADAQSKMKETIARAVTENMYRMTRECLHCSVDNEEEDMLVFLLVHTGDVHFAKKTLRQWKERKKREAAKDVFGTDKQAEREKAPKAHAERSTGIVRSIERLS